MPTRRRRRPRHRRKAELTRERRHLLHTGALPDWPEPEAKWDVFVLKGDALHGGDLLEALWKSVRDKVLSDWIRDVPGTRPWAWWRYDDSPRCSALPGSEPEDYWIRERELPEPRRRLGGHGTPVYECLNYVPELPFGIPTAFLDKVDEASVDGVAFDPNDPPQFESQAAYLDRHGLLTPAERLRLTDADFTPEIVLEV